MYIVYSTSEMAYACAKDLEVDLPAIFSDYVQAALYKQMLDHDIKQIMGELTEAPILISKDQSFEKMFNKWGLSF